MIKGRTFWITGATGCLGSEITRRVEELGGIVVPLVLEGYPRQPRRAPWRAATPPVAAENRGDLAALPAPDYLLHLHWRVDRRLSLAGQLRYEVDRNIHRLEFLWEHLLEAGALRVVNVSSISLFSRLNQPPVTAASEPRPLTAYGIAKLAGEKFLDACFADTRTTPVHLRLCSVAAACGHPSQLLPRLCRSAFDGDTITLNEDHRVRLLYLGDAADLIISAAAHRGMGPYLVAPVPRRVKEVAALFERVAGRPLHAERLHAAPGHAELELTDNADDLRVAWVRHTSLEETIAQIVSAHSRTRMEQP